MRICVIFSPAWHERRGARSTAASLHLGRSVSRLPNCLNSAARVYRVTSLIPVIRAPRRRDSATSSSCVRTTDGTARMDTHEDFAPRKYPVAVLAREEERARERRSQGRGRGRERTLSTRGIERARRRAERNSSSSSRDSQIPPAYAQTPQFAAVIF